MKIGKYRITLERKQFMWFIGELVAFIVCGCIMGAFFLMILYSY